LRKNLSLSKAAASHRKLVVLRFRLNKVFTLNLMTHWLLSKSFIFLLSSSLSFDLPCSPYSVINTFASVPAPKILPV
jgi:hypothetical protein